MGGPPSKLDGRHYRSGQTGHTLRQNRDPPHGWKDLAHDWGPQRMRKTGATIIWLVASNI
eukprot:11196395-Lingulodinium_polyedra.AAC.1